MFLRVRQKPGHLAFSIVSSHRVEGKVKQITHMSLGTVALPSYYQWQYAKVLTNRDDFLKFWRTVKARALQCGHRVWRAVREDIEKHLPPETHYARFENELMVEKIRQTRRANKERATQQGSSYPKRRRRRRATWW